MPTGEAEFCAKPCAALHWLLLCFLGGMEQLRYKHTQMPLEFAHSYPACAIPPTHSTIAETARFDYGSGGLHCKLAPQPAAAWAPRQHLQLGSGLVQKNDLYWEHFAGGQQS